MLIQALKNGLSLSGVKGDGTIVVIGVVLIAAILAGALIDRNRAGLETRDRSARPPAARKRPNLIRRRSL